MPRFLLVFLDAKGERPEIRDNSMDEEPHVDGRTIVEGQTYTIRGSQWVIRRGDRLDGMERFICTPAPEP